MASELNLRMEREAKLQINQELMNRRVLLDREEAKVATNVYPCVPKNLVCRKNFML
jgi:hypothetical protein